MDVPDPRRRHVARRGAADRGRYRVHVSIHPRQRTVDVLRLPALQPHVRDTRTTTRWSGSPRSRRWRRPCPRTSRSSPSTSGEPLDGKPAKEIRAFEEIPAVGSGPFQLTEWKSDQFWRMEARPSAIFGTPTIDEVVYHVYGNDEAMVQALKSGDIDYAYDIPPTLATSLEGEENIALNEEAADYHTNLAFNFGGQAKAHMPVYGTPPETEETNHPALHDHAVRLAIAHAIDKQRSPRSSSRARPSRRTRSSRPTRRSGIWISPPRRNTTSTSRRRTRSSTTRGTPNAPPTASGSIRRAGSRSRSTSSRSPTPEGR